MNPNTYSISNLYKIIQLSYRRSKVLFILSFFIALINGILPSLEILIIARLIDSVMQYISNTMTLNHVLINFFLLACTLVLKRLLPSVQDYVKWSFENKARTHYKLPLVKTISQLPLKYFENETTQSLFYRLLKDAESQVTNQYFNVLQLFQLILQVGGVLLIILRQAWWAALLILVLALVLFKLSIISGQANYQAKKDTATEERKSTYFEDVNLSREFVFERKIFGYTDEIISKFFKSYETVRRQRNKVHLDWFFKMKISGILVLILSALISGILAFPVLDGKMSIGLYISLVNAISSLVQVISWQLTATMDQLAQDLEYMKELHTVESLTECQEQKATPAVTIPPFESLAFKQVTFRYPDTETDILNNLTFTIKKGKHYSFVGKNGSGKTTITKLMTGLYDDYEGEILYNGISYRQFSPEQRQAIFAVVFQDFARYPTSVENNVYFGKTYDSNHFQEILSLLKLNDFVDSLPQGLKTEVSKLNEDGVDLSGGQWQKLAIARSIALNRQVQILDEPTSALDPLIENEMYEQFDKLNKGHTTIFISHRLGSTKLADIIYVIDSGRVIEAGSHDELIALDGLYHKMFTEQRGWYK
ncbi:ABC transporter ATP-binding protein [Streptococcus intermedius]|uniref:ABC transporter ATP-binding protein n=1 Tax=Streptococcus intermedius TaxID=1338 RepID=UPI000E3C8FD1|nr:ABC transporter ATP-binding protein [Streptococcus intermedius]RSJ09288.1 Lipid A export ATP-binding/permease protein MsbA [Streptococcus intermedius]RSJ15016.1 Lipid A export ATP-binding/permease protein MsbA [Streptococcus intermedius]RSJ29293.1 Lipid A export ATP-binding/permease protein MsbA [Streptococcus intermedius]